MHRRRGSLKGAILDVATVLATAAAVGTALAHVIDSKEAAFLAETGNRGSRRVIDWLEYGTEGHRIGPHDASVVIVEFLDFQCPFSRIAAARLRDLYPRDVAVVYRHFPLDAVSVQAAVAAECGDRAGLFKEIHDLFFEQQDSLGSKPWTRFAMEAGVSDTMEFAACLEDSSARAAVRRDYLAAQGLNILGPPSLLVNDRFLTGNPGLKYLSDYVDARKSGSSEAR